MTTDPSRVTDHGKAGDGAREVHARLVAARLRKLHADGATADELISALDESPAHERAWALGADGEEAVAGVLDAAAARHGFGVLHDLSVPASRANIDHVVVGAGGVTVIDTKTWSGSVRVGDRGVRVGGWSKRHELEAVDAQVTLVADVLRESGFDVPVRGVLCLANRNIGSPSGLRATGAVLVGTPEAVVASVATGTSSSRIEALTIMGVLERRFCPRAVVPVGSVLIVLPEPARETRREGGRGRRRRRRASAAAPIRRSGRSSGRGRRGKDQSLGELLARLALVVALIWGTMTTLDHAGSHTRLSVSQVLPMRPGLRARAVTAAGGPVHGPSIQTTATRIRLRYRRGACHIRVDLNRATARTPADGVITAGRRCRPA